MEKKFAFIGAGNMGAAMAEAVCRSMGGDSVVAFDPCVEKAAELSKKTGCLIAASAEDAVSQCGFVVLCVKPYLVAKVTEQLCPLLSELEARGEKRVILSIAAGVSIADIEAALKDGNGPALPVIRLLPNTPVTVGKGVIAMCCSEAVTEEVKLLVTKALSGGGRVMDMDEGLFDKATPVFSCSPAYVYMFIESLADGGVMCGVPRDMAQELAARAVMGSAAMVLESGKHPGRLKDDVCSPGGSTIVGVGELEKGGMRSAVISAVTGAYEKTVGLIKSSK